MEPKSILEQNNPVTNLEQNQTYQKTEYLDLELGDSLAAGSNKSQVQQDTNTNKPSHINDSGSGLSQQNIQQSQISKESILLKFLLMNISNGFKPTQSQIANVLSSNQFDTSSVNYWFRLFIERLIKINKFKRKNN